MKKILVICLRVILIIGVGFFTSWRIERVMTVYQDGDAAALTKMHVIIEDIRKGKSKMGNEQIADLLQLQVEHNPETYLINALYKFYMFFLIGFCSALIALVCMHGYFKNKIEMIEKKQ